MSIFLFRILWLQAYAVPFMRENELVAGHLGCLAGTDKKSADTTKAVAPGDLIAIWISLALGLCGSTGAFLLEISRHRFYGHKNRKSVRNWIFEYIHLFNSDFPLTHFNSSDKNRAIREYPFLFNFTDVTICYHEFLIDNLHSGYWQIWTIFSFVHHIIGEARDLSVVSVNRNAIIYI